MKLSLPLVVIGILLGPLGVCAQEPSASPPKPNIVCIFADDLGYGDLGCYGAQGYTTPHLDSLAAHGVRFTDFHVPAAVCSASRAALLTGCYPQRVSIMGALGPASRHGIHADEHLLPELLREQGYATAIFGKWHLGHLPPFLPTRHGFDEYFGLPYSNDMWPHHPTAKFPDLPLIEQERIVGLNPDQSQLTTWYTERAVRFIEANRSKPFFLYLPHSMPHVPLFVSDKFRGKTERGLFGDVIAELDWSVGQILATLERLGLEQNTLVLFTSDNGPWLSYGNHAGSRGPLREGKGTAWEGGTRVPLVARWPGKIPPGRVNGELATTMDFVPTLVKLAGGTLPADRPLDGHDIWPLLAGHEQARSPYQAFYHYWGYDLCGLRRGPWKLVFPHKFVSLTGPPGRNGQPGGITQGSTELALFNLADDLAESRNVAAENPQVVAELSRLAEAARHDLGDTLHKRRGAGVRPAGQAEKVEPPGKK